ncbi:Putative lipoprotein [hydrothermal vent metagenome]|uniref:Lipoprotein n=1 Tax=hydrothermal vent metagenome TaxID=652676 RepID=A0A3B1E4I7_9ZZZZ
MINKDFNTSLQLSKNNLDKFLEQNEKLYRFAIVSAIKLSLFDEALLLSNRLLKKYNNATSYEIIGNVYYAMNNYKKAIEYFESSYLANAKPTSLISLVNVLYAYLNQKEKAIAYLETFIRLHGCKKIVCDKLISFYREQKNINGMISILKIQANTSDNIIKKYKTLQLLTSSLEGKDIQLAIKFLEKNKIDNTKLLALYEKVGAYQKALDLVRKIYIETNNDILLGQIAILRFEIAPNKKNILKHVIANFELALKATNNPSYKNYYGYLLIDYGINIKKGLRLAKEALDSASNNIAYMDSVAWGYYKLKQCSKAFEYMNKVINQIGTDNKEIKLHWEKIQKCQE